MLVTLPNLQHNLNWPKDTMKMNYITQVVLNFHKKRKLLTIEIKQLGDFNLRSMFQVR